MTEEQKKSIYRESYKKWLEYFSTEFERYEKNIRLSYAARLEFESLVAQILRLLKKNGITRFADNTEKYPDGDICSIMIDMKGEGSEKIRDVMISTHDSCWTSILFEKTNEEITVKADDMARMDVELAKSREKNAEEKAKREAAEKAEWEARRKEAEERLQAQRSEEKKAEDEAYDRIMEKLETVDNGDASWVDDVYFSEDPWFITCSPNDVASGGPHDDDSDRHATIGNYVRECFAYFKAANEGLAGIGLYTFNNLSTEAHEKMLEAYGLEELDLARRITKDFDFCATFDVMAEEKYKERDFRTACRLLKWALNECVNFKFRKR